MKPPSGFEPHVDNSLSSSSGGETSDWNISSGVYIILSYISGLLSGGRSNRRRFVVF
jgi:hypothetical protein